MTDLNQMPHLITTDVNTEQRNVNIDNVNSRTVNSSNVNCTIKMENDKEEVTVIWRGISMGAELLRGMQTSLKYVLTASASITVAKMVNQKGGNRTKQSMMQ